MSVFLDAYREGKKTTRWHTSRVEAWVCADNLVHRPTKAIEHKAADAMAKKAREFQGMVMEAMADLDS